MMLLKSEFDHDMPDEADIVRDEGPVGRESPQPAQPPSQGRAGTRTTVPPNRAQQNPPPDGDRTLPGGPSPEPGNYPGQQAQQIPPGERGSPPPPPQAPTSAEHRQTPP